MAKKRYEAPDGSVLALDGVLGGGLWCIGWELEDGEIEVYLGEFKEAELLKDEDWEMRVAQAAVVPFANEDESKSYGRSVFTSKKTAQQALRAANEVLLRGDHKPWPEWAVKARAESWTPPEGWRP